MYVYMIMFSYNIDYQRVVVYVFGYVCADICLYTYVHVWYVCAYVMLMCIVLFVFKLCCEVYACDLLVFVGSLCLYCVVCVCW